MNRVGNAARQAEESLPVFGTAKETDITHEIYPLVTDGLNVPVENFETEHQLTESRGVVMDPEVGVNTSAENSETPGFKLRVSRRNSSANGEVSADLVRVYLNTIGKTALLTAEQEVDLSKSIEAGLYAENILKIRNSGAEITQHPQPKTLEDHIGNHALELAHPGIQRDYKTLVCEGKAAKEQLLEANLRLVVSIARRYTGYELSFLDLIQEGNVGLIRAVEKFDYHLGYKFSTYATWWIRQNITRAISDTGRTIRLPAHLAEQVSKVSRTRREMMQALEREPTLEELAVELDMTPERAEELTGYAQIPLSLDLGMGENKESRLGDFIEDTTTPVPEMAVECSNLQNSVHVVLDTLEERDKDVVTLRFGLNGDEPWTLERIGKKYGLTRERIRKIEMKVLDKLRGPGRREKL